MHKLWCSNAANQHCGEVACSTHNSFSLMNNTAGERLQAGTVHNVWHVGQRIYLIDLILIHMMCAEPAWLNILLSSQHHYQSEVGCYSYRAFCQALVSPCCYISKHITFSALASPFLFTLLRSFSVWCMLVVNTSLLSFSVLTPAVTEHHACRHDVWTYRDENHIFRSVFIYKWRRVKACIWLRKNRVACQCICLTLSMTLNIKLGF